MTTTQAYFQAVPFRKVQGLLFMKELLSEVASGTCDTRNAVGAERFLQRNPC